MHRLYMDKQGRVTIPRNIRRQLNLDEQAPLFAELDAGGLVLRTVPSEHGYAGEEEAAECVLRPETHKPAERRKILYRLLG